MAKFVVFTNANTPFEGREIVINIDNIVSVYKDLTAKDKVALWSKENFWHVEEDFNTVMKKLGLEYEEKAEEKELN